MMFIVPDELFNDLSCDICSKPLSVGPVKVYPNRKVKCGRCSNTYKDGGAISQYDLIMKHAIFKCVNRFDGCKLLLSSDQVKNHERTCHSRTNICPVCPETTEIPTFLLVSHFAKFHKDSFLLMPSFDMDVTSPNTKTYLYKFKDNLFFIESACSSKDKISFKAIFLGDVADAPTMKWFFTIEYMGESGKIIETIEKLGDCFVYVIESEVDIVHIKFEHFLEEVPFFNMFLMNEYFHQATLKNSLPRKVSLHADFMKRKPIFSTNSSSIRIGHILIDPHCYNCSLPMSDCETLLEVVHEKYRPLCKACKICYLDICPNIKFETLRVFLTVL